MFPQRNMSLCLSNISEPKGGLVCRESGLSIPAKFSIKGLLLKGGLLVLELGHSKSSLEKRFPLCHFFGLSFFAR